MGAAVKVIGGKRGFTARLEDMRAAGASLRSLGENTAELVAAPPAPVLMRGGIDSPSTWAKIEAAFFSFNLRARSLGSNITKLGSSAGLAAQAYESADKAADTAKKGGVWFLGWGLGKAARMSLPLVALPAALAALTAAGHTTAANGIVALVTGRNPHLGGKLMGGARSIFERAITGNTKGFSDVLDTGLSGFAVGFGGLPLLPPVISAFRADPLTRFASRFGEASGAFPTDKPEVRSASAEPGRSPGSLSGLYAREVAAHKGRENGRVRVDAVRGPDGRRRYIVYVPAMTDWSMASGRNTTDTATNVQTMAGRESAMRHVVKEAVKDAGIGPDDEVMLVGYSQGGIVAASLAADPEFRRQANVRQMVTVGSPVGRFDVEGTKVLSIEQDRDVIPALDGSDNPDTRDWTTIIADTPPVDKPMDAHSSDAYSEVIRDLEESGQPDIAEFAEDNDDFLNGRIEESREYEGVRSPKP